jgi:hypothetical protein
MEFMLIDSSLYKPFRDRFDSYIKYSYINPFDSFDRKTLR